MTRTSVLQHLPAKSSLRTAKFSLPVRTRTAVRIGNDRHAIAEARRLAGIFAVEASLRDRERQLPFAEVELFSQSGLWGITIPSEYGGPDLSASVVAEVTAIVTAADSSLGQIPQNHYYILEALRISGNAEQKAYFFQRALEGDRFGNALAEIGTKYHTSYKTRVRRDGPDYVLDGEKFYSTGVLFAHWVVAFALDEEGRRVMAFVPRDAPGLTIEDDWSGFGQRTTASGTTRFSGVRVPALYVVVQQDPSVHPNRLGSHAQLVHTAIHLGNARASLAETIRFVRTQSRAWVDSGLDHAYEDPYIIAGVGDVQVRLTAAEAMVRRAARFVDDVKDNPDEANTAAVSIAVAEAKVLAHEVAIFAANKLFELSGTKSTLAEFNLDRHWRNARTHTLHDPVRWKYHHIGNYWLNKVYPPRHGAL